MTCIIVDDEFISRSGIKSYVDKTPGLECIGMAENVKCLYELLETCSPDIVFMDIEMPGMSGMEFMERMGMLPFAVIVITAYERYALRGYDVNVTDYLLKPVSYSRFLNAVGKARAYMTSALSSGIVTLKCDKSVYRVPVDDILYVAAMENYLRIYTMTGKITVRMTLKGMSELLPADRFVSVHRSFIVNLDKISKATPAEIMLINGDIVPLSNKCRKALSDRLDSGRFMP